MRSPRFLFFWLTVFALTCLILAATLVALRTPAPPDEGARLSGYSARL